MLQQLADGRINILMRKCVLNFYTFCLHKKRKEKENLLILSADVIEDKLNQTPLIMTCAQPYVTFKPPKGDYLGQYEIGKLGGKVISGT